MTTFNEGDFQLDFSDPRVLSARKFDNDDHDLSHCMKAVDFVIELDDHYIFIEVKNPDHPKATSETQKKFCLKLRDGTLCNDLKYKYRDSFLYEWATGRANKPIDYYILIAMRSLSEADLCNATDQLARQLPTSKAQAESWTRPVVRYCSVLNLEKWQEKLPHYPVTRRAIL